MRLAFCAACGSIDDLQHHHLITRGERGSDDEERNLITLCHGCHAKLRERRIKPGGLNPKGVAAREEAKARAEALRPVLAELAGKSANAIAAELSARGIATPKGGRWHAGTVIRVLRRLEEAVS
jgi:Recombinase/HNH endonuclease